MDLKASILWFRHGLRLHDNPALLEAIKSSDTSFYPIFIFDGETAGTKLVGYNRMKFLLESLTDLDEQFRKVGGKGLFIFHGDPVEIFRKLHNSIGIRRICFEQDCEPIWNARDKRVGLLCSELGIEVVERISHTLWDPFQVISVNGGFPPLTYQMFLHTVNVIGLPPRPVNDPDFTNVTFGSVQEGLFKDTELFNQIPAPEDFSIFQEQIGSIAFLKWKGGEQKALEQLKLRLQVEENAFRNHTYLPNQANPDLLGVSTSMSAALRFGCLSVRHFYYSIHDLFHKVQQESGDFKFPAGQHITGQFIWREYFYTMSVKNIHYAEMNENPICLNIPWSVPKKDDVLKWQQGRTGFPIIDAAMRQLLVEGWLHHSIRNIVATFLTRSGLWLSWEVGLRHFLKYLLDADWSVCAGNWMWVSSSAFEKLLDSSSFSIIAMAHRLDPNGIYVKRYVPELRKVPLNFIHEPWKMSLVFQESVECVLGKHYPEPMIDLTQAMKINSNRMKRIRESLIDNKPHVRPSNEEEIRTFFWIAEEIPVKC